MAVRLNNTSTILILVIAVVAVAALGYVAINGIGAGAAMVPTETNVNPQGLSGQGTDGAVLCMNVAPQARLAAYYVDTSQNDKVTQVATNAYVCAPGASSCVAKTTATSGFNTTNVGEVGCLDTIDFIAGDGGATYYYGHSGAAKVTGQVFTPGTANGLEVKYSGALTMKFADASAASYGWNSTRSGSGAYNWTLAGVGAGGESQDVAIRVASPAKPKIYGDLGYALCFIFNSNNITSVKPANSNGIVTQPLTHVKATATLDTVQCYDMGKLPSGATQESTLYIKAKTGVTPSAATTIGVYAADFTADLYNGGLIPSYEYRNGNGTDIGLADVGGAAQIVIVN
jgi:hypothetical protein